MKTFIIALLALGLTACCACRKNRSTVPLVGTEWQLTQLNGTAVDAVGSYRVTFLDGAKVAGIGACNRFSGTYTLAGTRLDVNDNLVATKMMCLGENRENEFFAALRSVDAYSIDGQRLMLIRSGDVLAIFDPVLTR